jgi:ATP-dependent RNA helicase RhlE
MMQRMRDNKDKQGQSGRRGGSGEGRNAEGRNGNGQQARNGNGQQPRNGNGNGQQARNGNGQGRVQQPRPPRQQNARNGQGGNVNADGNSQQHLSRDDDRQPREGAHNIRSPFVVREPVQRSTDGQPDPLRTSVDSMSKGGRRGGNRTGGGGYGSRGPGNPSRTSNR